MNMQFYFKEQQHNLISIHLNMGAAEISQSFDNLEINFVNWFLRLSGHDFRAFGIWFVGMEDVQLLTLCLSQSECISIFIQWNSANAFQEYRHFSSFHLIYFEYADFWRWRWRWRWHWCCAERNQFFIIIDENEYSMNVLFISAKCDQCILNCWYCEKHEKHQLNTQAHICRCCCWFFRHIRRAHTNIQHTIAIYIGFSFSFSFIFTFKFNKNPCIKCLPLLIHIAIRMCTMYMLRHRFELIRAFCFLANTWAYGNCE